MTPDEPQVPAGRPRHRHRHHRRRAPVLRVRMRFAWWQLGVAALCMVLAGWVVMILQPWHPR